MSKKGVIWLLFLLLFSVFIKAEIYGSVSPGQTNKYITSEYNATISLVEIDQLRGRTSFKVNGEYINLLPSQRVNVSGVDFMFVGLAATSLKDLAANFIILNNVPFNCVRDCENNSFVDFIKIFDKKFELCKLNCSVGCGIYRSIGCAEGDVWIQDSCNEKVELLKDCDNNCIEGRCTNCGDGNCIAPENYFNCDDCKQKPNICLSDNDCLKDENCVNGKCTTANHFLGDGLCSLPFESCDSPDCSCDNENVQSAGQDDYPIIILHGFVSSPTKFRKLQRYISKDLGYVNGGEISYLDLGCPSFNSKTVYVSSYYEAKEVTEREKKLNELIQKSYLKVIGKSPNTESTFINILSDVMNKIKSCANTDKVNIIAHSMGGIVARSYLLEGGNIRSINKLILISSPNHGNIYGEQTYKLFKGLEASLGDRRKLLKQCSNTGTPSIIWSLMDGRDIAEECQQIEEAGRINHPALDIDETPGLVEYYTIAGNIDSIGDGVVPARSAALEGAVSNSIVPCDHFKIKDPSCKESYHAIVEALGYDPAQIKKYTLSESVREILLSIGDFFIGIFE